MLILPGLIDPHVHLRDPGQTQKEDFYTGTQAALAGGFTTILDMPNNTVPITTLDLLTAKKEIAKNKIVCDVGFYFGSLGDNLTEFEKVQNKVFGLKLFLNRTTGNFTIDLEAFKKICSAWKSSVIASPAKAVRGNPVESLPILVHAEENILKEAINIAHAANQRLHVCHIGAQELQIIIKAKEKGVQVTCGVTPHHLFLTENSYTSNVTNLAPLSEGKPCLSASDGTPSRWITQVKPSLKSQKDVDFLWKNIDKIDLIESDHAPHTKAEKEGNGSQFGFPGLETTLPLLLTAVGQEKLTIPDIKRLCHDNPAKIFGIPTDPKTHIEIDESEEWIIKNEELKTKSGWSPFNGWKVKGKVKKVFLHGNKVFENDKILVQPGSGKIIKSFV